MQQFTVGHRCQITITSSDPFKKSPAEAGLSRFFDLDPPGKLVVAVCPGAEVFVVHGELDANRRFFSNDPGIVAGREAVGVSCLDGHFGSVIR